MDAIRLLRRQQSGATAFTERELISAALQGNAKRMEAALKAGADVNAFDEALGSPLGPFIVSRKEMTLARGLVVLEAADDRRRTAAAKTPI